MENLTYTQNGDYLVPDIRLSDQPETSFGKYGLMRRSHLKEHRPILYNSLLLQEKLYPHLLEIEQTANSRMERMMQQLTAQNPPPDKVANQMDWAAHMNRLRHQAEKAILAELIYD